MGRDPPERRIAEEHLRHALRACRIVVWEWDLETGHLRWSEDVEELLGHKMPHQDDFEAAIHPADRERHRKAVERALADLSGYEIEMRFIRPDRTIIWIEDKAELRADAAGRRLLTGVTVDITARKAAEAAAQAHAERWQTLFGTMHEGFLMAEAIRDDDGGMVDFRFLEANPACENMSGLKLEEIVGRTAGEVIPQVKNSLLPIYSRVLDTGEPSQFEVEAADLSGRWYEVRARCLGHDRFAIIAVEITARRHAEAKAQEKSSILEATLENMDQGLIMVDGSETIRIYNSRALTLLDVPEELMRGPHSYENLKRHQRERGEFVRSDAGQRDWLQHGDFLSQQIQYERERPDGTVLEVRSVPIPTGGAVRTFTDITARRKAEAALRESESRFRTLLEAMPALVFTADRENRNSYVNRAYQAYTGLSEQELLEGAWLTVIHPDDQARSVAAWEEPRLTGAPYNMEGRLRGADGSYRWFLTRAVALRGESGEIELWLGTMLDIHDQKMAEEAFRESERRFRLLADNTGDMIALTGRDGIRQYISPASRDLCGYEPEEMLRITWTEQTHPDDVPAIVAQLHEMFASRSPDIRIVNYRLRHKDGHWVPVEARRRVLLDDSGEPYAVLSAIRDISERLELEERLRQAQKMEAVGQLTGGVAHDFNNLLTVIIGNTEMLAEEAEGADHRTAARMALESAQKGANLTQQLLAFARKQTLRPEPLCIPGIIQGIEPLLRRTIPETMQIVTELDSRDFLAIADKTLLETAILNLVVNAKDAMPGGGTITIRSEAHRMEGEEHGPPERQWVICITVSDTGIGMSPNVLEHAFEPFFTTKEVGKGSGLGLSMVYGFAEQSGGHVGIESKEGEGTSVTILLPAVAATPHDVPNAPVQVKGGSERILLVEDEPRVREFLSEQLARLGYAVRAVENGSGALQLLDRGERFDLLFTDIVLPGGMAGVELAQHARRRSPGIKVLFTSGYPEDVFAAYGRPDADSELLRKPFKRADLAAALRKVLAGAAA